ncbi:MAG: alpha/beta fold hydrolase [Alphaproteobacteria bacterium]
MSPIIAEITIPACNSPDIPAHTLACYAWGDRSHPALLCVHGLTRNGRDFDYLAATLSENFYVLCPDMPGRGNSSRLPATHYNYPTYLYDIELLLQAKNIQNVHWLGTSMGGIIAMLMANKKPGLIRSLILNDVGCTITVAALARILQYTSGNKQFSTAEEAQAQIRTNCAMFGIRDDAHWQHMFTHGICKRQDGSYTLHYDPAILAGMQAGELADVNLWPLWDAIKPIPTLLIRGDTSDVLLEETAAAMAHSHPGLTRMNIHKTGHAPALMAEEQTRQIKDWLLQVA